MSIICDHTWKANNNAQNIVGDGLKKKKKVFSPSPFPLLPLSQSYISGPVESHAKKLPSNGFQIANIGRRSKVMPLKLTI